jgi:hypothetical protein
VEAANDANYANPAPAKRPDPPHVQLREAENAGTMFGSNIDADGVGLGNASIVSDPRIDNRATDTQKRFEYDVRDRGVRGAMKGFQFVVAKHSLLQALGFRSTEKGWFPFAFPGSSYIARMQKRRQRLELGSAVWNPFDRRYGTVRNDVEGSRLLVSPGKREYFQFVGPDPHDPVNHRIVERRLLFGLPLVRLYNLDVTRMSGQTKPQRKAAALKIAGLPMIRLTPWLGASMASPAVSDEGGKTNWFNLRTMIGWGVKRPPNGLKFDWDVFRKFEKEARLVDQLLALKPRVDSNDPRVQTEDLARQGLELSVGSEAAGLYSPSAEAAAQSDGPDPMSMALAPVSNRDIDHAGPLTAANDETFAKPESSDSEDETSSKGRKRRHRRGARSRGLLESERTHRHRGPVRRLLGAFGRGVEHRRAGASRSKGEGPSPYGGVGAAYRAPTGTPRGGK